MLAPNSRLGKYLVVRQIGVGGMGAVFEGTHDKLRKRVAIKVLHPHLAASPATISRFLREGEAAASIVHPNVVTVDDVGVEGGVPFLAMEYLDGEDLGALLAREKRLPVMRMTDLILPVISAIACAHDRGIVHRDLKPENIFLCRGTGGGHVPKVLDFGISKVSNSHADLKLTGTNALLGTPYYMSPEQAGGKKDIDGRSDIFSLGVILYLCLTGSLPFPGAALLDVLMAIAHEQPPPVSSKEPSVPPELERVVERAMAKSPAARFKSARELGAALLPFASQRARLNYEQEFGSIAPAEPPKVLVTTQPAVTPPSWPDAGTLEATAGTLGVKPRRVWPALAVGLVVAGGAIGVLALRKPAQPPVDTTLAPAPPTEAHPVPPEPTATPGPVVAPALADSITVAPANSVDAPPLHVAPDKSAKLAERPSTKKPGAQVATRPPPAVASATSPGATGGDKRTGANDSIILH